SDLVLVVAPGHADDRGLQPHLRHRALLPALDAADVTAAQRHVVACHVAAHETPILHVDLLEPFHVRDAVPAGNDQADGRAVVEVGGRAVHLVGDEHLGTQRVVDVHASREVLLDLNVSDLLDALVRTVENDLDAAVLHAGLGEQIAQSYAAPARIPDQTVKDVRIVSAAFETGVDLDLLAALPLRHPHFDRPLDHPEL